jgi:hypothetical protein
VVNLVGSAASFTSIFKRISERVDSGTVRLDVFSAEARWKGLDHL